jgi:phosphatidylethanolamine/phosphatidyl-N-methylethanolamine N-methyltransferase
MFKKHSYFALLCLLILASTLSCAIHKARQKNAARVGELVPCSVQTAKDITSDIPKNKSPKIIIEVGAGSGAITHSIIKKMNEEDHLDLIEIEPILCEELQENFGQMKNVSIHCMDFLHFKPDYQYDYVVSTLPFNSFPADLVKKLIDHLVEVSKDGAYLGFVEFKFLPSLRTIGMNKDEKKEYKKTREVIKNFVALYGVAENSIFLNFPPILIFHLKIDKSKENLAK